MKYFYCVIAVTAGVLLVINPAAASEAVRGSVADCLETIVPSLFAFTVLAVYLQRSGLYKIALRPVTIPLSRLLRMDEELCAVFVLSNVGGYPVGVKLLSELVRGGRLSRENAARMLCCCFGSGPAFVVGIVGIGVFGNTAAGLALFGIFFAASLIIAAAVRSRGEITLDSKKDKELDLTADSFVSSVISGAKVMFTVCVMIVGFSVVTSLLRTLGVYSAAEILFKNSAIFPALLEVTRIKSVAAAEYAFPLCAALLSFGGVCVLMQISALSNGIPLKKLMISRAAASIISAILAMPFSRIFTAFDAAVFAPNVTVIPFTGNAVLSLCVLAMCAILLSGDILAGKR